MVVCKILSILSDFRAWTCFGVRVGLFARLYCFPFIWRVSNSSITTMVSLSWLWSSLTYCFLIFPWFFLLFRMSCAFPRSSLSLSSNNLSIRSLCLSLFLMIYFGSFFKLLIFCLKSYRVEFTLDPVSVKVVSEMDIDSSLLNLGFYLLTPSWNSIDFRVLFFIS